MTDTGTYLKDAREKRGLTRGDVQEATRIPRHYLDMMEGEGDSRFVSDPLYLVHYVRRYATYLQVEEPEQLAAQFIRENTRLQGSQKPRTAAKRKKSPRFLPWLLLLLVIAGMGTMYLYEPTLLTRILPGAVTETPSATANPPADDPLVKTVPATTVEDAPTTKPPLSKAADDAVSVLQPEAEEITPRPPVNSSPTSDDVATAALEGSGAKPGGSATMDPAQTSGPATPADTESRTDGQQLQIVAREKSWVRVIIDGKRPQDVMLEPGDARTWSADEQFVLTFGNAGGVDLTLNGEKLPPPGASGQVIRNYALPR